MKLTHFGHACVLVETAKARILIDPGTFSQGFEDVTDLDAVLITHQHADHLDLDRIPALLAANPQATFYVDRDSAPLVMGTDLVATVVAPADRLTIGGSVVDVVGGAHAFVYGTVPTCTNAAFVVDDGAFFHPGDSYFVPEQSVDVLALPTSGPWVKLAEVIDFQKAVAPRIAVPIHERAAANPGSLYNFISDFAPEGTTLRPTELGEATAL